MKTSLGFNSSSVLNFALITLLIGLLSACGFHMRGNADLAFKSLYIKNSGGGTIYSELKKTLKSNGIVLTANREEADMELELMSESYGKTILSLSGGGKVKEYQLTYLATFRTRAKGEELWGSPQSVEANRDYSFDDSVLLAKEGEEIRLNADMKNDATREILRRLSAMKSTRPNAAN
jgi:LPS-assembly lipoprotein